MASVGSVKGLALFNDLCSSIHCYGGLLGKVCRALISSTRIKTTSVGQVKHSDVCGSMKLATPKGKRYYVVFKDNTSGWCEVQLLGQKSEEPRAFKNFATKMEAETAKKIKCTRMEESSAAIIFGTGFESLWTLESLIRWHHPIPYNSME